MDPESAAQQTPASPSSSAPSSGSPPPPAARALGRREIEMLAFERQWWKFAGAKDQAIRELFDMSATRYFQILNTLLDRPEALAHDPMLVKRLLRAREDRRRSGSPDQLGAHG